MAAPRRAGEGPDRLSPANSSLCRGSQTVWPDLGRPRSSTDNPGQIRMRAAGSRGKGFRRRHYETQTFFGGPRQRQPWALTESSIAGEPRLRRVRAHYEVLPLAPSHESRGLSKRFRWGSTDAEHRVKKCLQREIKAFQNERDGHENPCRQETPRPRKPESGVEKPGEGPCSTTPAELCGVPRRPAG